MAKERVQRKLTTIFVADVEGYSSLMHADEEATLGALEANRTLTGPLIKRHGGRIFNTGGDSILAEFASAVEAVRCAVEFQQETAGLNAQPGTGQALKFRIGINIGDVMIRDDDLFGDGVNVAARLEGLADSGGICVSASVYEQVRNKVPFQFEDMGPQNVKNIESPVGVFRIIAGNAPVGTRKKPVAAKRRVRAVMAAGVLAILVVSGVWVWKMQSPPVARASIARMALPLPNKPSIAVLPFDNLGTTPKQELLSDGIVRDITADLSAFSDLMVIASTSAFSYKDKPTETSQVAENLGVRFVLSGSMQGVDENVRINIHLVDAISGEQLWTARYDRDVKDIFAIQDEITQSVVSVLGAMEGPVALADRARTRQKQNTNLTAYEYVLLARDARNQWTSESNAKSLELVQKAIALDPGYARAYVEQAWTYFQDITRYQSFPPREAAKKALESAQKAIELDETFAEGYWVAGDIYAWIFQQPDKAVSSYERALALNPNHPDILASWGGWILPTVLNRPQEGVAIVQKAMRLSPFHEDWYSWGLTNAFFMAGQYEDAIAAFQAIERPSLGMQLRLAASYGYLGRTDDADAKLAEILAKKPDFSAERYLKESRSYQSYAIVLRQGLLLAGFPE